MAHPRRQMPSNLGHYHGKKYKMLYEVCLWKRLPTDPGAPANEDGEKREKRKELESKITSRPWQP
mgnify:FL=1